MTQANNDPSDGSADGMAEPLPLVRHQLRLVTRAGSEVASVEYDESIWHLRTLELEEALNEPYRAELTLVCDDVHLPDETPEVWVETLVGADFHLAMGRAHAEDDTIESPRHVCGIVRRAWYLGTHRGHTHVRLEVGPALSLLSLFTRSRIFQGISIPDIVREVAEPVLARYGRTLDITSLLTETYEPVDYCVQYRESDLRFVLRILAEVGLGLRFRHDQDVEVAELFDGNAAFSRLQSGDHGPEFPILTSAADLATTESIQRFEGRRDFAIATTHSTAWDWRATPTARPEAADPASDAEADEPWQLGEVHDHQLRRLIEDEPAKALIDDTAGRAERVRSAANLHARDFEAQSNIPLLAPGHLFDLTEHPYYDKATYRVQRVVHRAERPDANPYGGGGDAGGADYLNEFVCVPEAVPFRPRILVKPRIQGHQLATVVGPDREEIHTDDLGRIKVHLHWDREGRAPDTTCWLRVAQMWAGAGWGTMFIPRVGMEVVVSFEDGDPDRPLVIGSVYNGDHPPPYPLPDDKTKTTIKTHSCPGGDGFNELRFEDAKDSEEVFLHAQKDLNEVVKHARTRRVGASENIRIGTSQTIAVGGSRTLTVSGAQATTIKGEAAGDDPPPRPAHTVDITGDSNIVISDHLQVEVQQSITVICGKSSIVMTPDGITIVGADASKLILDGEAYLESGQKAYLKLDKDSYAVLATPTASKLELLDAATMTSKDQTTLVLDANATATAAAGAELKMTGDVELSGTKTTINGSTASLTLEAAGATMAGQEATIQDMAQAAAVTASATGVDVRGAAVSLNGMADVAMTGPMVRINS